jgi:hypothetical protein
MSNTSYQTTRGLKAGETGRENWTMCLHESRILLPPAAPFATESTRAESNYSANIDYNQFQKRKLASVKLSRYGDWLQAGRLRNRSSSPGRVKNFLFSTSTGSGAHPVSYSIGTGGSFPEGKVAGAWSWPTSAEVKKT